MPSVKPGGATETEAQEETSTTVVEETAPATSSGMKLNRPTKAGERLGRLLDDARRPDGRRWTLNYLVDQLNERGQAVTRQYLGALLDGRRDNPGLSLVEGLADVFGVPVSFFSDDYLGRVTVELLPLLVAMSDPQVKALLTRTDLPEIAGAVLNPDLLAWAGDRPLAELLDTLRAPVVQAAIEETLIARVRYGTGR